VSGVQDLISVYRELASAATTRLHLGLTEAAWAPRAPVGIQPSRMGILLQEGIGWTPSAFR
jgi:(E)-4-hydroxy-3-methylbut-2-enyl-diphosphate synthase